MRIGILTFPGSPSHGAALQMFALYSILSQMGHEADVINYCSDKVIHNRHDQRKKRSVIIKNAIFRIANISADSNFNKFEKKIRKYPSSTVSTTEQLESLVERYDRIIVGSDQVWNPAITGNDMNFYLKFCKNSNKKASYAASFGADQIYARNRNEIAALLSEFSFISVREARGATIVKELIGKNVPVVLDPTMLLNRERWIEEAKPIALPQRKYVLFYTIKSSPSLESFAREFSNKRNYQLLTVGGRLRDLFDKDKHPVLGVGPAELLFLIDSAEYIITNSFHGTAFSIIMKKNFYIEYSSDTNSRLMNIVDMFEINSSVVNENTINEEAVNIDYKPIHVKLKKYQADSLEYIKSMIGE